MRAHFFISASAFLLPACGGQVEGDSDADVGDPGIQRDMVREDEAEEVGEELVAWLSSDRVEEPVPPTALPREASVEEACAPSRAARQDPTDCRED